MQPSALVFWDTQCYIYYIEGKLCRSPRVCGGFSCGGDYETVYGSYGGAYNTEELMNCTIFVRGGYEPELKQSNIGFRVVRSGPRG